MKRFVLIPLVLLACGTEVLAHGGPVLSRGANHGGYYRSSRFGNFSYGSFLGAASFSPYAGSGSCGSVANFSGYGASYTPFVRRSVRYVLVPQLQEDVQEQLPPLQPAFDAAADSGCGATANFNGFASSYGSYGAFAGLPAFNSYGSSYAGFPFHHIRYAGHFFRNRFFGGGNAHLPAFRAAVRFRGR